MMIATQLKGSRLLMRRFASAAVAGRASMTPADVQLKSKNKSCSADANLMARRVINEDEDIRNSLAYCLSFANDESDFARNFHQLLPDERMKEQLSISRDQLKRSDQKKTVQQHLDDEPLPRTLEDALRPSRRAIVITEKEAPFRVFDVNAAWENLCGYKYVESRGKTLGSLLRGPETDQVAATALIHKLLQGEEGGTTLTNYKKNGQPFRNRIRVGPLMDDSEITHFVGVLEEVHC